MVVKPFDMSDVQLLPINLHKHFFRCLEFRKDSFFRSFGTLDGFEEEMGQSGSKYKERMMEKCARLPQGNLHLWLGNSIVGQLEMRMLLEEESAYVNLFYVDPEYRGKVLGAFLELRAQSVAREFSAKKIRLSVSKSNLEAIGFYRHLGWIDVGAKPGKEKMMLMEKPVAEN